MKMDKEHKNSKPISFVFIGESYLGGMAGSKRIQNIINGILKNSNVEVSNLIIENPNEVKDKIRKGCKNKVHYYKVNYDIKNPLRLFTFFLKGISFIYNQKKNDSKNIIYCYDSPTVILLPFLLFAKLIGYKIVVDIVEDYNLLDESKLSSIQKFKLKIYSFLENNIFSYANGVICISNYLLKKFNSKKGRKKNLLYLPINVNFEHFQNKHIKQANNITQLFYGGSFGEKDGLLYLLKAFESYEKQNSNIELLLTGKPPKKGMEQILNYIKSSRISEKIIFLGYLKDEEYYEVLNQADILCMTRINSTFANAGFPFKLGEMLATGKPVIATNVGDVSNFITHKENALLIEPESTEAIVNALDYLITNKESASIIGKHGYDTAKKYFDVDIQAKSILTFVKQL